MPRIRRSGAVDDAAPDNGWWFSEAALNCLERTPPARITVIAAPAGSGKSRLVEHWLARSPHSHSHWLWIDLGPDDRDAELDQLLAIDELRRVDDGVLVISGLEMLSAGRQTLLIDRLPAGLRVILLSAGLGLPAGCLVRLAGELAELGPAELWWPPSVTGDRLHRLTAGWPAGVIILRRAGNAAASTAGDTPSDTEGDTVLDFVTEQTLDRLAPPLRRFVLRTSVLADLDPALCQVLVPDAAGHAMLAEARRQGLTALADHTRYRPMIAAAARRALRREHPGTERTLLEAAGEHTLATLASAAPSGFHDWSPATLRHSLTTLPTAVWASDAERRALVAFAAAISGDHLRCAEVIHQTPATLIEATPWWPALTSTILACCLKPAGRSGSSYRVATQALAELAALDQHTELPPILGSTDRAALLSTAHLLAARAGLFNGDLSTVRRHLTAGWSADSAQIPRYAVLAGLGADALASAWAGSLTAAHRRADRARRLAEQSGLAGVNGSAGVDGLTLLAGVEVLRARGHSAEALAELDRAEPTLDRPEQFVVSGSGGRPLGTAARILRAALCLDRADPIGATAALESLARDGDDDLPIALEAALAVARARLHLLTDDVVRADQVLARAPLTGVVASTRVSAALQRGTREEAQSVMRNWPGQDTVDNRLRLLLASAAIDLATDRRPEAGRGVDEALAVAEPEAHIQVFLESPPAVRVLTSVVLRRAATGPAVGGWRQELADRLDEISQASDAGSVPVTRRELAVLERLTTSLTHAQIAAGMFVSENTLKSHCRNLYRKLGVNSRADAVRAAQARGWLERPGLALSSSSGDVVLDLNITPVPAVVEL
jgi:LuxR family maltose regulon positive regulatory protein